MVLEVLTVPVEVCCEWEAEAGFSSLICIHHSSLVPRGGGDILQYILIAYLEHFILRLDIKQLISQSLVNNSTEVLICPIK